MILLVSVQEAEGGGAEVILEELLRGWPEPCKYFSIVCLWRSRISRVANELGIHAIELKSNGSLLSNILSLTKQIKNIPDCRIVHGWTARTFEIAWYIAKRKKANFYCTLHDHPASFYYNRKRQFLMRYFANQSDHLICVSNAVQTACEQFNYSCSISIIINGLIDTRPKHTDSQKLRLGFLGMHAPFKGFCILKDWINAIDDEPVEWRLYGEICESLNLDANRLQEQFPDSVVIKGRQKTSSIFGEIDVLLHLSTEFDSLPTVLIEAAMAGIPAIASNKGGAREIVVDGETGFIFESDDPKSGLSHLKKLLNNRKSIQGIGSHARQHYEKHLTVEKMVKNYSALWR